jgi:hypothetical protein
LVRILGGVVGSIYLAFGVGEVAGHLDEPASLAFWAPTLLGGGALVLYGVFLRAGRPSSSPRASSASSRPPGR